MFVIVSSTRAMPSSEVPQGYSRTKNVCVHSINMVYVILIPYGPLPTGCCGTIRVKPERNSLSIGDILGRESGGWLPFCTP